MGTLCRGCFLGQQLALGGFSEGQLWTGRCEGAPGASGPWWVVGTARVSFWRAWGQGWWSWRK